MKKTYLEPVTRNINVRINTHLMQASFGFGDGTQGADKSLSRGGNASFWDGDEE